MTPFELRLTRKKTGKTQRQFAALLHVSRATLNRWENGHWQIDPGALDILKTLAIPIAKDHSPAIYAYRNARIIFKKDHARSLRMAKVTLMDQGAPDFTIDDMKQIAIEYPGVVPDAFRAQLIEAENARQEISRAQAGEQSDAGSDGAAVIRERQDDTEMGEIR